MSKTIVKNDDNSQHKKIEKLIKEKLDKLKEKNENMDEIKKFNLLYELIKNPYEDLFDK